MAVMVANSVNILKTTELYTLNGWIVGCMNYMLIKLLKITSVSQETESLFMFLSKLPLVEYPCAGGPSK